MRCWPTIAPVITVLILTACGQAGDTLWFRGDLDAAVTAAAERDTLAFVEFKTEWCSWCRRLETETFTDREVRRELSSLVPIQLDAEADGAEAARRFDIDSYPTMVFLDGSGDEVERIVGYLPADALLKEIRRIRTGDTLFACLRELEQNPADADAIRRVVRGLLERSDPEGAIVKIKSFHAAKGHDHEVCNRLMFDAGRALHYRVYLTAAKLYRGGWERTIDVPAVPGCKRLRDLLDAGLLELESDEQAERMRAARFEDAADLLDLVKLDRFAGQDLYDAAEFAFRGGHYKLAGGLYERWFSSSADRPDPTDLNRAAWQLYLAKESLDTAVSMARMAHASDPSPDIADTLARLLYVSGRADEAIPLANRAASVISGPQTEDVRLAVRRMERGLDLGDRPAFETYPGEREPEP